MKRRSSLVSSLMLPNILRSSTAQQLAQQQAAGPNLSPSSQAASPATERSFEVLSTGKDERDKFELLSAGDSPCVAGVLAQISMKRSYFSHLQTFSVALPPSTILLAPTQVQKINLDLEARRDPLGRWYQNLEDLKPSLPTMPSFPVSCPSPPSCKELLILVGGVSLGVGLGYSALLRKDREHAKENQQMALALRGLTSALDRAHREKTEAILQASSSASRLDSTRSRLADALRHSQQAGKAAVMSAGGAALVALVALFL